MSKLFLPFAIGSMSVKNRFVRSATQDWLGGEDGQISSQTITWYEQLAQGGVGTIITAHSYVEHPRGKAAPRQNAIYDDRFISGYKKLAEAVHQYDTKLILQVSHAGVQTNLTLTEGVPPADVNTLTDEEIWKLVHAFSNAIRRAKEAGCDGAQVHMAHGYLLSRFISPVSNRRTDYWGGSTEKRANIAKEIMKCAKTLVGAEYPILIKLNTMGGLEGTAALDSNDVVETAKILEKNGAAAIEVSGGTFGETKVSVSRPGIRNREQEGYYADNAKKVKAAVSIPVILVGGLRSREVMEHVVNDDIADMVSLCRPFVMEPDLVNKMKQGQEKVSCISCNQCRNLAGIRCGHLFKMENKE